MFRCNMLALHVLHVHTVERTYTISEISANIIITIYIQEGTLKIEYIKRKMADYD